MTMYEFPRPEPGEDYLIKVEMTVDSQDINFDWCSRFTQTYGNIGARASLLVSSLIEQSSSSGIAGCFFPEARKQYERLEVLGPDADDDEPSEAIVDGEVIGATLIGVHSPYHDDVVLMPHIILKDTFDTENNVLFRSSELAVYIAIPEDGVFIYS
jgi:hypothetical protein